MTAPVPLIYKVLFPSISTFETPPTLRHGALRALGMDRGGNTPSKPCSYGLIKWELLAGGLAMAIAAQSSSEEVGSRHKLWRCVLVTGCILLATFLQLPHALSLDRERHATVNAGERVRLWFGANYGRRCASAGPPLFHLLAKPSLGKV